jgi:hypothetical protein
MQEIDDGVPGSRKSASLGPPALRFDLREKGWWSLGTVSVYVVYIAVGQ